ncbi:MAG TPA: MBL fold metallo-hydrolase [Longimicrobiales bacterium]|nr:MBL fold metallo-hydrolase [Longimicrobiales bacterium]
MVPRTAASIAGALAAMLLLSSPTLAQQANSADPLIRAEGIVQVGPHTWVIPDNDVALVPNVGIVVGEQATLVIDPGLGARNGEVVAREAARLSADGARIYVVATHYHPEHTTGFLGFPDDVQFIAATAQAEEFAESGESMIRTFASRSPLTAELLSGATVFPADITFDREYTLDLGGVTVRFIRVGPTHTIGDTGVFVEGDGVLFAGDVVMNQSFLAATAVSSMAAWLAAFDTFQALEPKVIVPAHGAVGDGGLIAQNRMVMQAIQGRVQAMKAAGRPENEVVTTVQEELRAQYPNWPRSNGIAAAARSAFREAP